MVFEEPGIDARFAVNQTQRLLASYRHWVGRELIERSRDPEEEARRLFEAPFVVVSGGAEADQILNYGNRTALDLWRMDWATFTRTPSRETAEPMHREERARLLERVRQFGYIDDYRGIRISSTGERFWIEGATVWNVMDENGGYAGQAATFSTWRPVEE